MPPATASPTKATASGAVQSPDEPPTPRTRKRITQTIHQCSFSPPTAMAEEEDGLPSPNGDNDSHSRHHRSLQCRLQPPQLEHETECQSPETMVLHANHHVQQQQHTDQQRQPPQPARSAALPKSASTRRLESELAQAAAAVAEAHESSLSVSSAAHASSSPAAVIMGPLQGAWGWVQRKRAQQRQEHLRKLAEEQMRRLQQAATEDGTGDFDFTVQVANDHLASVTMTKTRQHTKQTIDLPLCDNHDNHADDHDDEEQEENGPDLDDDVSWIPPVRWVEETPRKRVPSATIATSGIDTNPSDAPASPTNDDGSDNDTATNNTESSHAVVPFLLTPDQMHQIAKFVLPKGIAYCRWKRLYSLTRDGDSFYQCLRLVGREPKTLLLVKTTRGALFGGYADSPWEESANKKATGQFHGSAQACLFSFAIPPQPTAGSGSCDATPSPQQHQESSSACAQSNNHDSDQEDDDDDEQQQHHKGPYYGSPSSFRRRKASRHVSTADFPIQVFHWTGANRYIQYCDTSDHRRMLAFGGGGVEGAFGLSVEQDFQHGSTGSCDTFDNLPLCEQEQYSILDLEIWGFLTGQF